MTKSINDAFFSTFRPVHPRGLRPGLYTTAEPSVETVCFVERLRLECIRRPDRPHIPGPRRDE